MTRKRIPTGLSGILALDKPAGMTSHDVVNRVRRLTGERRVGHAGTLDPAATGLLLVCVGPATRLADYLMVGVKTYEARICFGTATNTDDSEGEIIRTCAVPTELADPAVATELLDGLLGDLEQVPPAYSAIKKDGVKAYKAARSGEALELDARQVHLYDAQVIAVGVDYWDVELVVSKGFYVRSFARDVGELLGSAAHLGALRRTASGNVRVRDAVTLEALDERSAGASDVSIELKTLPFIDPTAALGLPQVAVSFAQAQQVQNGVTLTLPDAKGTLICLVADERMIALYERVGGSSLYKPKVVIPGGVGLI